MRGSSSSSSAQSSSPRSSSPDSSSLQARAPHHGARSRGGTASLVCGGDAEERDGAASPVDGGGAEQLEWRCTSGPRRRRAGAVAAARRSRVGASLATRGRWGRGERSGCLPTPILVE
ncbi:hypothetical protein PVAP13_1NG378500 [Panicum virgatum]|uniref:Uncharacterized protein n=1 Tax=Panicum virgatum TaxID=38727 RepID=A0A8T0X5Z5_PANVG|nr:hypothetical protein PVAP13_1NG378500 [Panicum virgatum]